jgi:hypothetical protein
MSLKKALQKKIHKARLAGSIVKDSVVVNVKRPLKKRRFYASELKTIIVDMDGTIFRSDSSLEALNLLFPEKIKDSSTGELIYRKLIQNIVDGTMTVDEAMVKGTTLLKNRGLSINDFKKILEKIKPKIRFDLIKALKEIQLTSNVKIILATFSSKEFGKLLGTYLNEKMKFNFDEVIGSEMEFDENGIVIHLIKIVGMNSKEIQGKKIISKFDAVIELFNEKKWDFNPNQTLLITDSYGDIELIKKIPSILISTEKPDLIQKYSSKLKLADFIVKDDGKIKEQIEKIIFN